MSLELTEIIVDGYEQVVHCVDDEVGLNAFISVHDTTLGPALGGMRMWPYASEAEALQDVNRLAKAMTYKAAVAQTGQGGGKAVIIGDPSQKTEALMRAMGRAIESLHGTYIAAEDMNMTVADLEVVREETRWVTGFSREHGSSGNPSPVTAAGCLCGIEVCVEEVFGAPSLDGRCIAIMGVGAVGGRLAALCREKNADVIVSDVDRERAERVASTHGCALENDPDELLTMECDVLAPCARGGILNDATIPALHCKIIAGAANNQLAENRHAEMLAARGILYAPDYVINAGGVINIACEFAPGGYDEAEAYRRTRGIGETLRTVFRIAREQGITTAAAADRLAEQRIAEGRAGA